MPHTTPVPTPSQKVKRSDHPEAPFFGTSGASLVPLLELLDKRLVGMNQHNDHRFVWNRSFFPFGTLVE